MVNFVSPGVYTVEKDFSDYIPAINPSVVGAVGFASRGPINDPTLVTDAGNLLKVFGRPDQTTGGQGLWGAYNILERTNSMYFVRAATEAASSAFITVPPGTPAVVNVSGLDGTTYQHVFFVDLYNGTTGAKTTDSPYVFVVPKGSNVASSMEVLNNKYVTEEFEVTVEKISTDHAAFVTKAAGDDQVMQVRTYACSSTDGFSSFTADLAAGGNGLPMRGDGGTYAVPVESDVVTEVGTVFAGDLSSYVTYLGVKGYTDASDQSVSGVSGMKIFGNPSWSVFDDTASIPDGYFTASGAIVTNQYTLKSLGNTLATSLEGSVPAGLRSAIATVPFFDSNQYLNWVGPVACSTGNRYSLSGTDGGGLTFYSLHPGAGYNYAVSSTNQGNKTYGLRTVVSGRRGKDSTVQVQLDGATAESYLVDFQSNSDASGTSVNKVLNFNTYNNENTSDDYYVAYNKLATDVTSGVPSTSVAKASFEVPTAYSGVTVIRSYWGDTASNPITRFGAAPTTVARDLEQRYVKLADGTYDLAQGVNGDAADHGGSMSDASVKAAFIGSQEARTGMQGFRDDTLNISMLAIPGVTEQNIINAAVSLSEDTQNFLLATAPPVGLASVQEAINWHNGDDATRSTSLNSSYATVTWPWIKVFNVFTGADEYIDPAVFAIRQYAFTDQVADPWVAPAGFTRGRLVKPVDVEFVLNQGDRDALYSGGNVINPIVKFPQQGLVLFGQRTTQRAPTALDRINVRRLMISLRKAILAGTTRFVFEPNDAVTRRRVTEALQPLLQEIKDRRGITAFKIICDETVNTPIRIDRNELWCKVIIQPTKAAEIVVFEFNVTNQTGGIAAVE